MVHDKRRQMALNTMLDIARPPLGSDVASSRDVLAFGARAAEAISSIEMVTQIAVSTPTYRARPGEATEWDVIRDLLLETGADALGVVAALVGDEHLLEPIVAQADSERPTAHLMWREDGLSLRGVVACCRDLRRQLHFDARILDDDDVVAASLTRFALACSEAVAWIREYDEPVRTLAAVPDRQPVRAPMARRRVPRRLAFRASRHA